ncbi:hypothetical protein A7M48_19020 [Acinetobacter baumannii]|nr:hypothetical protein A7M48_19020 [Acinetobacter baumannii]
MLIRSGIQYTELPAFQEEWAQCALARISSLHGDLTVGAVYFPPRHSITETHLQDFFESFGPRFIAAGDFNAKHSWWGSRSINPNAERSTDSCRAEDWIATPLVSLPTGLQTLPCCPTSWILLSPKA